MTTGTRCTTSCSGKAGVVPTKAAKSAGTRHAAGARATDSLSGAPQSEDTALPWKEVNGISVHYRTAGERGPVVVLMHEMGGSLDSWDGVVPGLAERFRVLRYDQRGQGLTE